jgi:predicted HTH domain antitoxin
MYKELLYSKLLVESVRSKSTGEFHYVYVVVSEERPNCFYFGKHSTHNLNDGYLGSSSDKDWNSLKRILYPVAFFHTDNEAIEYETLVLQKYDLKNNPFCINKINNDYVEGGWNRGISINEQHRDYVKYLYENEKISITKIANKIGLSKGSVMVLLKQAKVILRENRTTSYGDAYWRNHIKDECERRGLTAVCIPPRLSKWSKVRVHCDCGGEREVLVTGLKLGQTCCRHFSKQGDRNPMKGKVPPNKGKKCPGVGGRKKKIL